jgi:hypothetical protein
MRRRGRGAEAAVAADGKLVVIEDRCIRLLLENQRTRGDVAGCHQVPSQQGICPDLEREV